MDQQKQSLFRGEFAKGKEGWDVGVRVLKNQDLKAMRHEAGYMRHGA